MSDRFGYIYDDDRPWTWRDFVETGVAFLAMAVCLAAVAMLFLCGD